MMIATVRILCQWSFQKLVLPIALGSFNALNHAVHAGIRDTCVTFGRREVLLTWVKQKLFLENALLLSKKMTCTHFESSTIFLLPKTFQTMIMILTACVCHFQLMIVPRKIVATKTTWVTTLSLSHQIVKHYFYCKNLMLKSLTQN